MPTVRDALCFGFGLVAAGVLGFILQQWRSQGKAIQAYDSPMTVILKTEKTPHQVARAASAAQMARTIMILVVVGSVGLLYVYGTRAWGWSLPFEPPAYVP